MVSFVFLVLLYKKFLFSRFSFSVFWWFIDGVGWGGVGSKRKMWNYFNVKNGQICGDVSSLDPQVTWNEEERKSLVLRQHSYRSAVRDFGEFLSSSVLLLLLLCPFLLPPTKWKTNPPARWNAFFKKWFCLFISCRLLVHALKHKKNHFFL
jgi:hypothetical protein